MEVLTFNYVHLHWYVYKTHMQLQSYVGCISNYSTVIVLHSRYTITTYGTELM